MGKQIRHLRTQSGMTQEELAGKLNVTRQALSNWERDVNEPDLVMLKEICFLFGVHMDDFFAFFYSLRPVFCQKV
jgi:transcriptional regulator with XRE-family HTH domain